MKQVTISRSDPNNIWSRSQEGKKFEYNGKLGLENNGDIILEPIYDQIELCKEYLYTKGGDTVSRYYSYGMVEESAFNPSDRRFYENGKIGLKSKNGDILFPAIYDCIKDWSPYDVIYVRNDEGFHYFNHECEEILMNYKPIDNSDCDDEPFFIDEKQSTGVIITRKIVGSKKNDNCVRYGQNWVELDRFPKSDIANIIGECEIIPMPVDALDGINSKSTYIYAGFLANSQKEKPVEDCVAQLCMLGAYQASWNFITKIWIHPDSIVPLEELKKFWLTFSNCSDFYSHDGIVSRFTVEDWLRIGIGYNDQLAFNEVKVLQIHYFTDRWPARIESQWVSGLRHLGVNDLQNLKKELDEYIRNIKDCEGEEAASTVHKEILEGCHISSNISSELSIDDELKKYDYLKSLDFHCLDTLWYMCHHMMEAMVKDSGNSPIPLSREELDFIVKKIDWLLANGTIPNYVSNRLTALDMVTLSRKLYEYMEWPLECQSILAELEITMRKKGCRYAREFDINDLFWREFKPGLYDESPFAVKPYTNKVIIGDAQTIEEDVFND